MSYSRRNFFKKGMAGVAAVAIGSQLPLLSSCAAPSAQKEKKTANVSLKLSFQEGIVEGDSLNAKFDKMEQLGITGFEPGGSGLTARAAEIQDALKGRKINVSAICAGFKGFPLSTDDTVVNDFLTSYKEIIAVAGALGAVGVVMVPAFNHQQPSRPHTPETREWLVGLLKELGDYALQNGTAVILEPLNRVEAFYLRQVADAASICRDTNSKGVTCMGDFWHMTFEETSDYGAFHAGGDYLSFVHIASRKHRVMPGEDGDADNYIAGFKALKEMNYSGYVSFECSSKGARSETVPAAVKLLNEQWNMA